MVLREIPQFKNTEDGGETFYLEEGDSTYYPRELLIDGRIAEIARLSKRLDNNSTVQISTKSDICVEAATEASQAIGFIKGDPRGELPRKDSKSGEYPRRWGNVVLMGCTRYQLNLTPTNQEILPGDSLILTKDGKYDKSKDATNIKSLIHAPANSGKPIAVLHKSG